MSEYPGTQYYEGQAVDIIADQIGVLDPDVLLVGQHLIDLIAHALKYADLGDDASCSQLIDTAHADFSEFVHGEEVVL